MSLRYPDHVQCSECGLTVAGNATTGAVRAHTQKAVDAGHYTAACADTSNVAQELRAGDHRREAAPRRREYWDSLDRETTITDEGTAQRR